MCGSGLQGILQKINAIKVCSAEDASCTTTTSIPAETSAEENSGFIMFSGAYVWGFQEGRQWPTDGFLLDYNGMKGPNILGQDIIYLIRCYDDETQGAACLEMPASRHGQMSVNTSNAASLSLYNDLFAG
jgi:hypothetical protein